MDAEASVPHRTAPHRTLVAVVLHRILWSCTSAAGRLIPLELYKQEGCLNIVIPPTLSIQCYL